MENPVIQRAQHLRANMTGVETRMWWRLRARQLGVKFRRQHPIGPLHRRLRMLSSEAHCWDRRRYAPGGLRHSSRPLARVSGLASDAPRIAGNRWAPRHSGWRHQLRARASRISI